MISVCMASYNGSRFIRDQIVSILEQLSAEDELIISDDGSDDGTVEIITSFRDSRVRLISNPSGRGVVTNFENALQHARGDIVMLSDQDDIWLEGRVKLVREAFISRMNRYFLLMMDGYIVNADNTPTGKTIFEKINAGPGLIRNLWNNRYVGCCLALSRELLEVAMPFPSGIPMHDMWLGQLCEWVGETRFVAVPTIHYRRHPRAETEFKIRFRPLTQIRRRWSLLTSLVGRVVKIRMVKA